MDLILEPYEEQLRVWPKDGRHILAQYDDASVVVYQAHRPSIGRYAVEHQRFAGGFSFGRMSWIKPNFLWMMYRSGWGTQEGQEVTLAISIARGGFDRILRQAVHSTYQSAIYAHREAWATAARQSDVLLQWDPDHSPTGERLARRAIQLGLRGATLRLYASEWIAGIQDISDFVAAQRCEVKSRGTLQTPKEELYPVTDEAVASQLRLSSDVCVKSGS